MPFEKGKSGNPEGRRAEQGNAQLRKLLEPYQEKAAETIAKLLEDKDKDLQFKAAKDILDRCFGKARQQMDLGATKEFTRALLSVTRNPKPQSEEDGSSSDT